MVGAAPQVLDQQQPSFPQTLSSEEEEAIKRNTDCVYFLASPLTCKKGSECEYRHSEYARVNPRDCWFWLNGNCLNLKCGFRHPPLDGLVGTHTTNPTSSPIPSQTSAIVSTPNPFNASKQAVPCIFFQKGLCLKGDRCAFLHGPSPASTNKVSPAPANAQAGERRSLKKISGGIQRCSQEQRIAQANFSKSVGAPPKLAAKDETMASVTGNNNENNGSATEVGDGGSRFKAIINSNPILNESSLSRTNQLQQSHVPDDYGLQNGKDVDEFLKESSPGFDVLVDDELRGSGYYGSEETYGRTRGHEGTNMISMNEYDMGHSADYKMVSDIDQDIYNDVVDYDYDDSRQRQYGWEKHRTSSEKLSLGSVHMESRLIQKSNSPECVQDMDLRHRLNKHRRVNGLRSVVNNDNAASRSVEERNYRASRRESEESSISSRLLGRIKPRIPSPVRNSNLRPERDLSRVRHWGRLSPGRSQSSSYLGSVRDEIKGRVEEDYNNERRNFNSLSSRRDRIDGTFDFAPPKSLAELKGEKSLVSKEQQMLGKRKSLAYNEQSEGEVSFKGPKSLDEILKKKRQVEADVKLPVNNAESENRERLIEHSATTILKQSGLSSTAKLKADSPVLIQEGIKSAPAKTVGEDEEKIDVSHSRLSEVMHSTDHENEDGMTFDETLEDHEYEGDDQRDGEYEYEQGDDGEYTYEEGDNVDPEEEYMDDEDGDDDFAKNIGVMS